MPFECKWPGQGRAPSYVLPKPTKLSVNTSEEDTSGLELLVAGLGSDFDYIHTDTTGGDNRRRLDLEKQTRVGMPERFATIFRRSKVSRGQLVTDLSFDRTAIVENIQENRESWFEAAQDFAAERALWGRQGGDPKKGPKFETPEHFVDFTRTPSVFSFVVGKSNAPKRVAVINAHMVYGKYKHRVQEQKALAQGLCTMLLRAGRFYWGVTSV